MKQQEDFGSFHCKNINKKRHFYEGEISSGYQ
jgi:hypothetical protein